MWTEATRHYDEPALGALPLHIAIPLRTESLRIADAHGLDARDAYLVACARRQRCPLLTLDRGLARAARAAGVEVLAVA